jgi:hypothetical protein
MEQHAMSPFLSLLNPVQRTVLQWLAGRVGDNKRYVHPKELREQLDKLQAGSRFEEIGKWFESLGVLEVHPSATPRRWQKHHEATWREWYVGKNVGWDVTDEPLRLLMGFDPVGVDQPSLPTDPAGQPTVWRHGKGSYSDDGRNPVTVSKAADSVLAAFMEADKALSSEELGRYTDNVSQLMGSLDIKFPGRVRRPGRKNKGAGYFVRVRPAAPERK